MSNLAVVEPISSEWQAATIIDISFAFVASIWCFDIFLLLEIIVSQKESFDVVIMMVVMMIVRQKWVFLEVKWLFNLLWILYTKFFKRRFSPEEIFLHLSFVCFCPQLSLDTTPSPTCPWPLLFVIFTPSLLSHPSDASNSLNTLLRLTEKEAGQKNKEKRAFCSQFEFTVCPSTIPNSNSKWHHTTIPYCMVVVSVHPPNLFWDVSGPR